MKKNSSYLPYFTLAILLILVSCQKNLDLPDPFQQDDVEGLSIGTVQQWFTENHRDNSQLRQSSQNTKSPNWSRALYLDFQFGEAVVVPLVYKDNYSVSFIKDKTDNTIAQATMPLNALSYLIVYKNKDNKYVEEVIRIAPSKGYVVKSNYLKKKAAFDGMIQVSNWDGESVKAYLYENGELIGKNLDSGAKSLRAARLLDCYETSYYLCPSENLTSSGEIINYAGCDFMSSSTMCFNVGGSSGGGGGDSYSDILGFNAAESPVEKVRKLAAKIPAVFKDNLKCVPFSNALKKAMISNNITGKLLEVRSTNDYIVSSLYDSGNTSISINGFHQAIRVGDTVFDNNNPNGVDYAAWRGSLDSLGTITVTPTDF